jgi:hypothetical protein
MEDTCVGNNMDWKNDYINAQWDYIDYMRETLDYNITLIPLTIIPITAWCDKFPYFTM